MAVLAAIVLIALIWAGYSQSWAAWTGFGEFTDPKGGPIPAKTLWDWLQLLIVPFVLAVGGFFLNRAQTNADDRKAERQKAIDDEAAEKRAKIDREIANDRAQEALLQSYLDRMTELLLEKGLRTAKDDSEVVAVAKARTVTILRRSDQPRRASLLTFLRGSRVIQEQEQDATGLLRGADLNHADLSQANLTEANLSRAKLSGASLSGAILRGADLSHADLTNADLTNALMYGANLSGAKLSGTNLDGAKLTNAILTGAKYNAATQWPEGFTPPPEAVKVEGSKDEEQ